MNTSEYDFELPSELIAQSHAHPRDASRLLVVDGNKLIDARFADLANFMRSGDVLVLNETRVIAARVFGKRVPSGGRVEILLLHPRAGLRYDEEANVWSALVRPGRRMQLGQHVEFDGCGSAQVTAVDEDGTREITFGLSVPFSQFLERCGRLPLPPYIHNETQQAQTDYQTVFARVPGSVAAPTASLHFTQELLQKLRSQAVEIVKLTLDVGLGTFAPMKSETLTSHHMHAERFHIPPETVRTIREAKAQGRRVIAAGTTVVRALEGSVAAHGELRAGEDETALFITPGFDFRVVDAMITNFHLPRSTLLVLVSAFAGSGRIRAAYEHAIKERYRFFSFGDAMLLFCHPRGEAIAGPPESSRSSRTSYT